MKAVSRITPYIFGTALGVAFLATLVRLACSVFFESQMRLGELVLCVVLVGSLTCALMPLLPAKVDPEQHFQHIIAVFVSSCLFVFAGAARGWSAALRKGETRWMQRLAYLAAGWFTVLGLLAGAMVFLLVVVAGRLPVGIS